MITLQKINSRVTMRRLFIHCHYIRKQRVGGWVNHSDQGAPFSKVLVVTSSKKWLFCVDHFYIQDSIIQIS